MTDERTAILHSEPLLALIPLADCETGQIDALIEQLNLRAFAVLAQAMTDEPADRPDTLDETALSSKKNVRRYSI